MTRTEYMRKWRAKNPQNKKYQKQYQQKYATPENKSKARKRANDFYRDNKEQILKGLKDTYHLKRYNLSREQYVAMLDEQNDLCAICYQPEVSGILAVDHDHITGQVRGLLCRKCNTAIGMLQDSPEIVERAKQYLIFYK